MRINIRDISLIVYDFDGVMTDNKILVLEDGKEGVFCNRADGFAIQKIKELDIPQIILSTEKNQVLKVRAKKLDIELMYNVSDKKSILINYCKKNKYNLKRVVYLGNDINDLEAMKIVGFPLTPKDANDEIKRIARALVKKKGGEGVIKEFFENILSF